MTRNQTAVSRTPPAQWQKEDPGFTATISQRFGALHVAAMWGERFGWREGAADSSAQVIALDQLSRHIHCGPPAACAVHLKHE